jgi:RHS repeat-associated protein
MPIANRGIPKGHSRLGISNSYGPYGETLLEQENGASYLSPYTFSAKEKDTETGYSYFGARYYSAELSVWLSVDPMSDKYPSLSAYNYCTWNPIMLVDPDGREAESLDPPKCFKFGDSFLKKFADGVKSLFWYNTKTTIKNEPSKAEKFSQSKTDEPLSVDRSVKTKSTLTFESRTIEDQLIVKRDGEEVVNTGSVGTRGNPIVVQLEPGEYNITVVPNTNPEQSDRGSSTVYDVRLQSNEYQVKQKTVDRLWGILPFRGSSHSSTRNPERTPIRDSNRDRSWVSRRKYF